MKKGIVFDKSKKVFPIIIMVIGIILALALQVMRLNLVAVVNVAYMCIVVALMMLGIFIFKKLYVWNFITYGINALSVVLYYTIWVLTQALVLSQAVKQVGHQLKTLSHQVRTMQTS